MSTIIQSFEARELKKRPFVIKVADYLTSVFGSFSFVLLNFIVFTFWILANSGRVPNVTPFDNFPYPLLTIIVSFEAIFLSVIVLMSQNRQSHVATIRSEIDMHINRIAEKEITKSLSILRKLAEKQGVKMEDDDLDEMTKNLEISYIERKLAEQLAEKPSTILKKVENVAKEVEKSFTRKTT